MKYIKLFDSHQDYTMFKNSTNWIEPNVSYCISENELHYNPVIIDVVRVDLNRMDLGSKSVGDTAGAFSFDPFDVTDSEYIMLNTLLSTQDDNVYGKPVYDMSSNRVYTFETPTVVPPTNVTIKAITDSKGVALCETNGLIFGTDNNIMHCSVNTAVINRVYNAGIGSVNAYYSCGHSQSQTPIYLSPSIYPVCQEAVNVIYLTEWYSEKYDIYGDGENISSVTSILDYNNTTKLPISGEFVAGGNYSGSYFPDGEALPIIGRRSFYIMLARQIKEGSSLSTITSGKRYRYTILNNVIEVEQLD